MNLIKKFRNPISDYWEQRDAYPVTGGEKLFLYLASAVVLIMIAIAIFALPAAWGNQEATVGLITLVFATTVGFAGAWAVVILAGQALDIQQRATKQDDPEYILALDCLKGIEHLRAALASLLATWRLAEQMAHHSRPSYMPISFEKVCSQVALACEDIPMSVVLASTARYVDKYEQYSIMAPDLEINFIQRKSNLAEASERLKECFTSNHNVGHRAFVDDSSESSGDEGLEANKKRIEARLMRLMICGKRLGEFINELADGITKLKNVEASKSTERRVEYFAEFASALPHFNISAEASLYLENHRLHRLEKAFDTGFVKRLISGYADGKGLEASQDHSDEDGEKEKPKCKLPIIYATASAGEVWHIEQIRSIVDSLQKDQSGESRPFWIMDPTIEALEHLVKCREKKEDRLNETIFVYFTGKPRFISNEELVKFDKYLHDKDIANRNYNEARRDMARGPENSDHTETEIEALEQKFKELDAQKWRVEEIMQKIGSYRNTIVVFDNLNSWILRSPNSSGYLRRLVEVAAESGPDNLDGANVKFNDHAMFIFIRYEPWWLEEITDDALSDEEFSVNYEFTALSAYAERLGWSTDGNAISK